MDSHFSFKSSNSLNRNAVVVKHIVHSVQQFEPLFYSKFIKATICLLKADSRKILPINLSTRPHNKPVDYA